MILSKSIKKWLYKTDGKWVALQAAIAMGLSQYILYLNGFEFSEYAGLAVVVTAQPNISESLARGKERLISTVFGGLAGIMFVRFFDISIINVSIAIFFIMYFLRMTVGKPTVLAAIIFTIIVALHQEESLAYSIHRLLETLLGALLSAGAGFVLDHVRKKFGIPDDRLKT